MKVVREILREEKMFSQIASEYATHANVISRWRDQALAALPGAFNDQAATDQAAKEAAWELVAILDWYSRYVLAWELDQSIQVAFVLEAMQRALTHAKPVICNSDQGSQCTSTPYLDLLKAHDVRISMDGRGRALDTIFTERLWRTIKYEEVYIKDYDSPREARRSLTEYLQFYNERRLHQSLEYRTPAELYFK